MKEFLIELLTLFKQSDADRLKETHEARDEAERWRAEGDNYGWNFHQGRSSGTIGASIIYHRVQRAIERKLKELDCVQRAIECKLKELDDAQ
jgi:hypothetical protein